MVLADGSVKAADVWRKEEVKYFDRRAKTADSQMDPDAVVCVGVVGPRFRWPWPSALGFVRLLCRLRGRVWPVAVRWGCEVLALIHPDPQDYVKEAVLGCGNLWQPK